MGVNIKDICKETNLSLGTVSNYLNGRKIREENRISIENAIQKMGYQFNSFGRNLKTNRSQLIGVVLPYLDDLFSAKLVSLMEVYLRKAGYAVIICDTNNNEEHEKNVFNFLSDRRVDGIICFPTGKDEEKYCQLINGKIPIVFLDRELKNVNADCVLVNNYKCSKMATEYLIKKGHRKIGILCGPEGVCSADQRLQGYKDALEDNNVEFTDELVRRGEYTQKNQATELVIELLKKENGPTAIFATNYYFTMGAVIAANITNKVIGKDFSLFGFDNLMTLDLVKPSLTLVEQPLEKIAEIAANTVIRKIYSPLEEKQKHIIEGIILEGESVLDLS